MRCWFIVILWISFVPAALAADGQAALRKAAAEAQKIVPATQPAAGFESAGVRAIYFETLPWKGKPTRAFAWVGMPEHKPGEKVPAMVLVHGGGGTAFDTWVSLWTSRGYAAIAMDTCGQLPRGTYGHWERDPQGGPAGWGGFDQTDLAPEDQWTFHAVIDVILAHSLLRSMPDVDADRIGITGISWGGYLTCITAGLDHRFKMAVSVYGCGFLGENSAWLPDFKKLGPAKTAAWLKAWDPSEYLPDAPIPMLWVSGTNDFAYPFDSLQKSYRLPKASRQLTIRVRMPHGHGPAGENPEEIHTFANTFLKKTDQPLPTFTKQGRDGTTVWAEFQSSTKPATAELNYTKDVGPWQDRKWETIPATIDTKTNRITATLPEGAKVYYINLVDERKLIASTEHVETGH